MDSQTLNIKQVTSLTKMGVHRIRSLESKGLFPKRCFIGKFRIGWKETEITDWINKEFRRASNQQGEENVNTEI